jgi:DNA-binding transcriptional MerR regulator
MKLEELDQNQQWLLAEFVDICNQLLPDYLPDSKTNLKVKEEINPRLVRHYTGQKLLDEPLRSGKYAVYTYRHLLQFLVVRRLLSQGIGAIAINDLITSKTNDQLKGLLTGGIQINVTTVHPGLTNSNAALDYLKNLKKGKTNNREREDNSFSLKEDNLNFSQSEIKQVISKNQETNWTRIEVLEGLEIHLRSDFVYPNSIKEQENLQQFMWQKLTKIFNRKKP